MFGSVKRSWWCVLSVCVVVAVMGSSAWAVRVQPDETDSDDVFTYQYHGTNPGFNVAPFADLKNLDTDSVGAPIGLLLGTSRSLTTPHMIDANGLLPGMAGHDPSTVPSGGVVTGHDGFSWLRFDLSGVGVTADKVGKVTLNLWSLDGFDISGSFYNPIAAEPVETEVYAAAGPWGEQDLTWDNQDDGPSVPLPMFGSPVDSVIQTGVERWVNFDVTSLVKDWLNNPAANNGFFPSPEGDRIFHARGGAANPCGLVAVRVFSVG